MPFGRRPTDQLAREHGFSDAADWYKFLCAATLLDPATIQANFATLPKEKEDLGEGDDPGSLWWRHIHGASTTGRETKREETLRDYTALLASETGVAHPYLFSEVRPYTAEKVGDLREKLHEECLGGDFHSR